MLLIFHCSTKKFFLVSESFSSVLGYIWAAEFESVVRFFPSCQTFKIYAVVYAINKNTCIMANGKIFICIYFSRFLSNSGNKTLKTLNLLYWQE